MRQEYLMKALVIEDTDMFSYILTELLFGTGVTTVIESHKGTKAIDYIKKQGAERLSCVFLNINIELARPGFLDDLMEHSIYQDIPVFILTDTDTNTTCPTLRKFKYEISAYLSRPFSKWQIQECVELAEKIESYNPFLETHSA